MRVFTAPHVTSPNRKQPDIYYWRMGLQTAAQAHHRILLSSKKEQITVHTVTPSYSNNQAGDGREHSGYAQKFDHDGFSLSEQSSSYGTDVPGIKTYQTVHLKCTELGICLSQLNAAAEQVACSLEAAAQEGSEDCSSVLSHRMHQTLDRPVSVTDSSGSDSKPLLTGTDQNELMG